jgi:hypothetical protein
MPAGRIKTNGSITVPWPHQSHIGQSEPGLRQAAGERSDRMMLYFGRGPQNHRMSWSQYHALTRHQVDDGQLTVMRTAGEC